MNPFRRIGVETVINAAGKMTALGGSAQHETVAQAQAEAAQAHVDLAELRHAASQHIATRTGAEAACITTGAAAGIALGVAAILTGRDLEKIRRVPDVPAPRDILIQRGHDVDFGAEVTQMIRLGGGRPVVFGTLDAVTEADLAASLSADAKAIVYVKSHHAVQQNRLPLDPCLGRGVPVLVDAAAESDIRTYIAAGADLVTYSGGKAIGGPTCGFIAGRRDLIEACELQGRGIARAMKVGKEQIMGLMAALDRFEPSANDDEAILAALHAGLSSFANALILPDRAGRPIRRVALRESPDVLQALVQHLAANTPSIRTRNHQLNEGLILFDVRELRRHDVDTIVERVRTFYAEGAPSPTAPEQRRAS
ncbi:MAG: SelA-like pyridoxal phosphate-dependent enzyme [Gammaproteobacteria bacterium]|nr:SelA-like pyridoxal phosphate-dependent enzyme [Gammaproteobacteria bacterium]MYB36409.1 SelA-like pyridoxal phosphate-dependent enzyme [Gammaproteobacteria bacterium]